MNIISIFSDAGGLELGSGKASYQTPSHNNLFTQI